MADLPLIDCYPFRQGNRYSIMLVSRRLDAPTDVTLKLPYTPQSGYTLPMLTGNSPAVHNIDEELVKMMTEEKTGMTREFTIQVPPHSALLLVNEAVLAP